MDINQVILQLLTSYSQFEVTEIVVLKAESCEIKRTLPKCLPLPIALKGASQIDK